MRRNAAISHARRVNLDPQRTRWSTCDFRRSRLFSRSLSGLKRSGKTAARHCLVSAATFSSFVKLTVAGVVIGVLHRCSSLEAPASYS